MFSIARSAAAIAPRRAMLARPFSTTSPAAFARMQLLGRLVADPEVRSTRSGKDYVRYTVATNDPPGPPGEDGERPPETSSFHSIFAFGEGSVQRLQRLQKGTLVLIDAEFRVQRTPASEEGGPTESSYLVQHKSYHVISRPKTEQTE